jgi:hypothetical protein
MTYPSALKTYGMTGFGIFSDNGPTELATMPATASRTIGLRDRLLNGALDQCSRDNREDNPKNKDQDHRVSIR